MHQSPEWRYVSPAELRRIFNSERFWEKLLEGVYTARLLRDAHPSPPLAGEPQCTRSQYIAYLDAEGEEVARAHQYLRRDGTIGLSGRPDPKLVVHHGVAYYCTMEY